MSWNEKNRQWEHQPRVECCHGSKYFCIVLKKNTIVPLQPHNKIGMIQEKEEWGS